MSLYLTPYLEVAVQVKETEKTASALDLHNVRTYSHAVPGLRGHGPVPVPTLWYIRSQGEGEGHESVRHGKVLPLSEASLDPARG